MPPYCRLEDPVENKRLLPFNGQQKAIEKLESRMRRNPENLSQLSIRYISGIINISLCLDEYQHVFPCRSAQCYFEAVCV